MVLGAVMKRNPERQRSSVYSHVATSRWPKNNRKAVLKKKHRRRPIINPRAPRAIDGDRLARMLEFGVAGIASRVASNVRLRRPAALKIEIDRRYAPRPGQMARP